MILLLDNYESFVYNLSRYVNELGCPTMVVRNDTISVGEVRDIGASHIILSPGPCTPAEAGISTEVVRQLGATTPVLGVCLGHQSIGQAFGADIVRADRLMHGKTDNILHDGSGIFAGLENPFIATRYHSLIVRPGTLPKELVECAWSESSGGQAAGEAREIMGVRHREYPLFGMQFHPESFLTTAGTELLKNFLKTKM
jgi:anthranilate synthase component 2